MLLGRFSKLIKQTPTSLAHGRRQLILAQPSQLAPIFGQNRWFPRRKCLRLN